MTTQQQTEQLEAIANLKKYLKPGSKVYTVLRHVSSSGMMRVLDLYVIKKNEPLRLTWSVCKAIGYKYNRKHDGLEIGGWGMDMGLAVVYYLSRTLFPDGFVPAKAGSNGRNGTPATERDPDGGYALKHEWM